jgi:hypothetical protein
MIQTIHGFMDESDLDKRQGVDEDDSAKVSWVEYRLPGGTQIVHRSAHVELKGEGMDILQGAFA